MDTDKQQCKRKIRKYKKHHLAETHFSTNIYIYLTYHQPINFSLVELNSPTVLLKTILASTLNKSSTTTVQPKVDAKMRP
jgi:hypothetical protein